MRKAAIILITLFFFASISAFDFVVATDNSGDYKTIQEAIDATPDFRKNRTTIFIKKGTYKEKLILPSSKTNVTFIGEDRDSTLVTYDDFASKNNIFGEEMGTTGSTSFYVFGDGFMAKNITFENSFGTGSQAVAVRVDGDKVTFKNCKFLGFQDTLYPHGKDSRQYYKDCYIEGSVDFIFGWSTAVFEECTIFCKEKGYITAPATNKGEEFGFVFINCNITGTAPHNSVYLGRPWRAYGKSVFIKCHLDQVIKVDGWHNWGSKEKEKKAFFAEYNTTGEGATKDTRVKWSKQLTARQAQKYSPQNILGEWINSSYITNNKQIRL